MPKPKGTPGGNPQPVQTAALKAKQYKRIDANEMPLDARTTGVRLYARDGEMLRSRVGESQARAAWLRRVIHAAIVTEFGSPPEEG